VQIVPGRHGVDEDVLVRSNPEIIVEQASGDLERLAFRRWRRHLAAAQAAAANSHECTFGRPDEFGYN
jgi:hypothetical protein